jgi:hypothetical protein
VIHETTIQPQAATTSLGFCLYRSLARPGLDAGDLDRILQHARARNERVGLTGCLHYEEGMFFQWIEGPRFALFGLLDALRDDDRHMDVTVLDQGPLQQRLFQDWQMRFSDRRVASLLDWLAERRHQPENPADYAGGVGRFLAALAP